MLQSISIRNYAIIEHLEVGFKPGLTAVTGETGAGKSIILGAFGLICGQRAESKSLRNEEEKCIVEAEFLLQDNYLKESFEENDLDYEKSCIIRREILPSGKSRAFINDTPVGLEVLKYISTQLLDIHAQQDTQLIHKQQVVLQLLDSFGQNNNRLQAYEEAYTGYKKLLAERKKLLGNEGLEQDIAYLKFLAEELEAAQIKAEEQVFLEEEIKQLSHAEELKLQLAKAFQAMDNDHISALGLIKEAAQALRSVAGFGAKYEELYKRLDSVWVELQDLSSEIESEAEKVEDNPQKLIELESRLNTCISLQNKHQVADNASLIERLNELSLQIENIEQGEKKRKIIEQEFIIDSLTNSTKGNELSDTRKQAAQELGLKIKQLLVELNLPHAAFEIRLKPISPSSLGMDEVVLMFSANAGMPLQELGKVASGGELSRLMLALKAVLAESRALPTIFFDEIDTGVSGATAGSIADLLRDLSKKIQIIAITHLPQMASAGNQQLFVFKDHSSASVQTQLRELVGSERIDEIARLLSSSSEISETARNNAREMLGRFI